MTHFHGVEFFFLYFPFFADFFFPHRGFTFSILTLKVLIIKKRKAQPKNFEKKCFLRKKTSLLNLKKKKNHVDSC
jgi:hypothetical protein